VNKTESGVRVAHLPTGLSATAQEKRLQALNPTLALSTLGWLLQRQEDRAKGRTNRGQHNRVVRANAARVLRDDCFKGLKDLERAAEAYKM
jgi:peptide chain release factor